MTRVLQFQTQKILKSLKTIIASVHVVAEEDILDIRYLASLLEEFPQTVTGVLRCWRLLSEMRISFTFSQSLRRSLSGKSPPLCKI
jgi:hypothetical protein